MAKMKMGGGAAQRALEYVDSVLAGGGPESKKLWDILTALRGPDRDDQQRYKGGLTAVIRSAAFPKAAVARSRAFSADFAPSYTGQEVKTGAAGLANSHYGLHVEAAAVALGLDVDKRDPAAPAPAAPSDGRYGYTYGCGGR